MSTIVSQAKKEKMATAADALAEPPPSGTEAPIFKQLGGLEGMADLILVSEELNLKNYNLEAAFMNAAQTRRLKMTMIEEFRVHSLDQPLRKCKVYLFNDLLIVARYYRVKPGQIFESGSRPIVYGDLIGIKHGLEVSPEVEERERQEHEERLKIRAAEEDRANKKRSALRAKGATNPAGSLKDPDIGREYLRLKIWTDLSKCRIKYITRDGQHGMEIMYTVKKYIKDGDNGGFENYVKRTEFWCKDMETCDELVEPIIAAKATIIENQIKKRREDLAAIEKLAPINGHKRRPRTFHKKREFNKTLQLARLKQQGRKGTTNPEELKETLAALQSRYGVDFTKTDDNDKSKRNEFNVEFGEGPMGMSFSSHEEYGVFVVEVADGSMASESEVLAGDRIIAIDGETIPKEMHWREAMKSVEKRPIMFRFSRHIAVEEQVQEEKDGAEKNSLEIEAAEKVKELAEVRERGAKRKPGKKKWLKIQDEKKAGGKIVRNMEDMEKKYTEHNWAEGHKRTLALFDQMLDKEKNLDGRQCLFQLKEIYETEKRYIAFMDVLQYEYYEWLKNQHAAVLCKDLPGFGVRMCEHKSLASVCKKESSRYEKIADENVLKQIFMNIPSVVVVNRKAVQYLEDRLETVLKDVGIKDLNIAKIVAVFTQVYTDVAPFFKLYSPYAYNYVHALSTLNNLRLTNRAFHNALREREQDRDKVSILLMMPVQRLCRYQLMFSSLIDKAVPYLRDTATSMKGWNDYTIEDSRELETMWRNLQAVHKTANDIAVIVDADVAKREMIDRLLEVHVELGGDKAVPDLLQPSRRFVLTTNVWMKRSADKSKKEHPVLFYLFNNMIIIASTKSSTWKALLRPLRSTSLDDRKGSKNGSRKGSKNGSKKGTKNGTLKNTRAPSATQAVSAEKKKSSDTDGSGAKLNRNLTLKGVKVVVKHQIPIIRLKQIKSSASKDGRFGFFFIQPVYIKPGDKLETKKKNKGTSIVTETVHYHYYCDSEQERDELVKLISTSCQVLKKNEQERQDALWESGAKKGRRRRFHKKLRGEDMSPEYEALKASLESLKKNAKK